MRSGPELRRKRLPFASRFIVLLAACTTADHDPQHARNLSLEVEGRFGSADGALSLTHIGGMAISHGAGDTVFITQFQVPHILLLSSAGDSIGTIGRAGSGPGEFSAPFTPVIFHDTVWVQDVGGPISRFLPGGTFIDQLRLQVLPLGPFQHTPRFGAALADGSLLFQGRSNPVGREAREAVRALAWARVGRDGTVLDTLALLAVRETSYMLQFPDGRGIVGGHPAANPDVGAVDPQGRWLVVAAQHTEDAARFGFTLFWITVEGDTVAAHQVPVTPVSSEAIRQEWIDRLASSEVYPRGILEAAANDVPFPAHQAPALGVIADPEGRAWVKSPHVSPDSIRWHLVDQARGVVGSVAVSKRVDLMAAKGEVVWGWERGPYDEPYVLRFSVRS